MKDENFNDKQMQEENKNREIMHRIKESAEKEKIPESLNPDNLDDLLKQGKDQKINTGSGERQQQIMLSAIGRQQRRRPA